jgi:hypothetical protein
MANTYAQIYIHIVFAVQVRDRTLRSLIWFATLTRDRLDSSMIAAGLQADAPGRKVSVRFPTPHSQLSTVIKYIQNQQEHHRCKSLASNAPQRLKDHRRQFLGSWVSWCTDPGFRSAEPWAELSRGFSA